jgi:hypothetical protein
MSKKRSDWYFPEEVLGLLSTLFLVPAIAVLTGLLFSVVEALANENPFRLFFLGLFSGTFGITVLFRARWPLYRQHRFWTFGPRDLDQKHRRLYWIAHAFVFISITLLIIVWFRVR